MRATVDKHIAIKGEKKSYFIGGKKVYRENTVTVFITIGRSFSCSHCHIDVVGVFFLGVDGILTRCHADSFLLL